MRHVRSTKLNLMAFEDKITPTVKASLYAGNLTITGDSNPNTVYIWQHATKTDVFAIHGTYVPSAISTLKANAIPANQLGSYAVTGDITVVTGNSTDAVVVAVDDKLTMPGNLRISTAKGNDDIYIGAASTKPVDDGNSCFNHKHHHNNSILAGDGPPPAARPHATIAGNLNIFGGDGADNTFMFDMTVVGTMSANGGTSALRPQAHPLTGAPYGIMGGDVLQLFNDVLNADLVVAEDAVLFDDEFGGTRVDGNVRVTDSSVVVAGNYRTLDGRQYTAGGLLVVDLNNRVVGDIVYHGSNGDDGVYVDGYVDGNIDVIASGGKNKFVLKSTPAWVLGGEVGGHVNYAGTTGIDAVSIGDCALIGGDVNLNVGAGTNQFDLDHIYHAKAKVLLTGGTGDDNVGKLGGNIDGDVIVKLGDGANTINFKFNGATSNINYTGGSGVDSVTLTGTHRSFTGATGGGNDVVAYAFGATLSVSFSCDFGLGSDTYVRSPATVTWAEATKNLETTL